MIAQNTEQSAVAAISVALRHQDLDRALELSREALKNAPEDYRLWTLRGVAYYAAGKQQLALDAYRHALKSAPDYLPALEGAGQVEYQQGRDGQARRILEHILLLRPADPTAHAMLASIEFKASNCGDAVRHFQQAEDLVFTQAKALVEYGACLGGLNGFNKAITIFKRAVDLEPGKAAPRYNLALAEWKAGQPDAAIATLKPLLQSWDAAEYILILAADIYESQGNTPRAVELLRHAIISHPRDKTAYLNFANLSFNYDSIQVGIDMLNVGLKQLPDEAELYLVRGILYCQLGNTNKGVDDFETANRLDPGLSSAGAAKGIAASQESRNKDAIATLRAQARQHPADALTQYLLAEALTQGGKAEGGADYQEALRAATLAVKFDPKLSLAHDLLATMYLRTDRTELAIQHSQEALKTNSKDQPALYHLIVAFRKSGRKGEIPGLLKRLMDARDEEEEHIRQSRYYQLVEVR